MRRMLIPLVVSLLALGAAPVQADSGNGTSTTGFRDWSETRTARVCGQLHEGNRSTNACWTDSYQVAIGDRAAPTTAAADALLERTRQLVR